MKAARVLLLSLFFSGCGGHVAFTAREALQEGVAGKSWGSLTYLEPGSSNPSVDGSNRTHNHFSGAQSGDTFYLAATFYDGAKYKGYVRKYTPTDRWSSTGVGFQSVATSTSSLDYTAIGATSGGGFLAGFLGTTDDVLIMSQYNGSWRTDAAVADAATNYPPYAASVDLVMGSPVSISMDQLGRGRIFVTSDDGGGNPLGPRLVTGWEQGSGATAAFTAVNAFNLTTGRSRSIFDGVSRMCTLYSTGGTTTADCLNTTTASVAPLGSQDLSGSGVNATGYDLATDGAGEIMAVFFQEVSGVSHVYASVATTGTFATAVQIDGAVSSGYVGASANAAGLAGESPSPAVAYMGSGKYMAAWVSIHPTSKKAALYYSIYSSGSWSSATLLGSLATYTARPTYLQPVLSGATSGHVTLATRIITSEGATAADDVSKLLVYRYHQYAGGWVFSSTLGTGCAAGVAGNLSACTRSPVVAQFSGGDALVVFQDQDSSGYFRLASVEFK